MKKLITKIIILLFLAVGVLSCKKGDQGPAGFQGLKGNAGNPGAKGDTGPQGNANVTVFNYDSRTFRYYTYYNMDISKGKIDSSLLVAYYEPADTPDSWFPVPGTLMVEPDCPIRSFIFRTSASVYQLVVEVMNHEETDFYQSPVTFKKFRIFLIPANNVLRGKNPTALPVNVRDYNSVKQYYHLPDYQYVK